MTPFNSDSKDKPLASRATFAGRLPGNITVALALVAVSLGIGIWGIRQPKACLPSTPS